MPSRLISRTFRHQGQKVTMRLEIEFWTALEAIANQYGISMGELLLQADGDEANRTGSVRVLALEYYRKAAAPKMQLLS